MTLRPLGETVKTLQEIKTILSANRQELRERYHVGRIGIFGSRARLDATPISDVDILVELEQPTGWEIVDLHRRLEELLQL
ncbi:MAG: nucleotidyltransferase domain-containing protein, partial [Anaerolineales bacterium]|nr:nucleotidyltransferase domain-containing protein [Anaerolineales bacterium]